MNITIWDVFIGFGTFIKFLFLNGLVTCLCFFLYAIYFFISNEIAKKTFRIILLIFIIILITSLVCLWSLLFSGWSIIMPCIIALTIIWGLVKKHN